MHVKRIRDTLFVQRLQFTEIAVELGKRVLEFLFMLVFFAILIGLKCLVDPA